MPYNYNIRFHKKYQLSLIPETNPFFS